METIARGSESEGMGRRGVLIAIEGIDGAGKTTHATLLKDVLERRGYDVVLLKEPTGGVWGARIRELAHLGRNIGAHEELELFLRDRKENAREHILPALARGSVVVMDRYYPSSMAYQGALGLDPMLIKERSESIAPRPDLIVVLDVSSQIGVGRIRKRGDVPNYFEDEGYLERVRAIFRRMVEEDMGTLVDATLPVEQVHARILELVEHELRKDC